VEHLLARAGEGPCLGGVARGYEPGDAGVDALAQAGWHVRDGFKAGGDK
jgi:hypothetical protein